VAGAVINVRLIRLFQFRHGFNGRLDCRGHTRVVFPIIPQDRALYLRQLGFGIWSRSVINNGCI
jgi:hypothetical protein